MPRRPGFALVPAVALLLAVAPILGACSSGSSPAPSAGRSAFVAPSAGLAVAAPLTVFGAASLEGALERAKVAWVAANPGSTVTISTDSSTALETQIEQGAPADVFLSADTTNPQKLVDEGLAAGAAVPFAGNQLAVIVPATNPAEISTPADLAKAGVKVIAAGDGVPITRYADQLIANLAREAGYPAGFAAAYAANVVSREDNVNAVVAKIELGEGDAAVVYVTDARASTRIMTIDVPDTANVLVTYSGVVVKASANVATAHAFLDWIAGADGQAILAGFGLLPRP